MTKTKLPDYHYKNSTLDRREIRKAILEVYGDDLYSENDEALGKELDISIREADNGEELPYEEVSAKFRKKYSA